MKTFVNIMAVTFAVILILAIVGALFLMLLNSVNWGV